MPATKLDAPDASLTVGRILQGKYRLVRHIDEGGMGVVWAAEHLGVGGEVALKVMRPSIARDAGYVERFLREAKVASRLHSPHAVRVHDVGVLENGAPFLIMELLVGESLDATFAGAETIPIARAVDWILEACDAIAEAHGIGIVHRDIKPANLFLCAGVDGKATIKVLDFGIAKFVHTGETPSITTTTDVFGSPRYMSPEQLRSSRHVDARTDIWALGAILYEALARDPPFNAEAMTDLTAMILRDPVPPLSSRRRDVPPGLLAALDRCLEKDRDQRFSTVADLAAAIAPFGGPEAQARAERVARILLHSPMRALPPPTSSDPIAIADAFAATTASATPVRSPSRSGSRTPAHSVSNRPEVGYATTVLAQPGANQDGIATLAAPRKRRTRAVAIATVVVVTGATAALWLASKPRATASDPRTVDAQAVRVTEPATGLSSAPPPSVDGAALPSATSAPDAAITSAHPTVTVPPTRPPTRPSSGAAAPASTMRPTPAATTTETPGLFDYPR